MAVELPPDLAALAKSLPRYVSRKSGAEIIGRHLFPVSHRTLEAVSLPTQHINGKALIPTDALLSWAFAKVSAAPVVMGGRKPAGTSAPARQRRITESPATA